MLWSHYKVQKLNRPTIYRNEIKLKIDKTTFTWVCHIQLTSNCRTIKHKYLTKNPKCLPFGPFMYFSIPFTNIIIQPNHKTHYHHHHHQTYQAKGIFLSIYFYVGIIFVPQASYKILIQCLCTHTAHSDFLYLSIQVVGFYISKQQVK